MHPDQKSIPNVFKNFNILYGCVNILNVPFGTRDYVEQYMMKIYQKLNDLLDVINMLNSNKQIQWLLISRFDNINKINYYIRNIPYSQYEKWVVLFDELEQRKRDILFGTGLTTQQIQQTQLATKEGGLALRTASHFYSAANLASRVKNCVLMHLLLKPEIINATNNHVRKSMTAALEDYNSKVSLDNRVKDIYEFFDDKRQSNPYPKLQSQLFARIENKIKSDILQTADPHVQCLFQQFKHKKCHNWLQTDPWLFQFSNLEFLMALYRRFRITIQDQEYPCVSCGVRVMDIYCDHATLCAYSTQNPKRRHDAVKLLLLNMGKAAGFKSKLEQNPTTEITSKIKPADVLFENYQDGQDLAVDVTIISPFRSGLLSRATSTFMYTADKTYIDKLKKYKGFTFKEGVTFKPFVMEEFGSVQKEAMTIFNRLCECIAIRTDKELTEVKFEYSKLLSSSIKRHNSRAILTRLS